MLTWIIPLILRNQDDFWLNILAGVPFLLFDIVIITMLLPFTIQWWEERRWQNTRLIALAHLCNIYEQPLRSAKGLGMRESRLKLCRPDDADALAVEMLRDMQAALSNFSERIDEELQTALPILGPAITEEVLGFHYEMKAFVAYASQAIAGFDESLTMGGARDQRRMAEEGMFDPHAVSRQDTVRYTADLALSLSIKHRIMQVKFALSDEEREDIVANNIYVGIRALDSVLQGILLHMETNALSREHPDFWGVQRIGSASGESIAAMGFQPPVEVYIHRGLWGKLSGKAQSKIIHIMTSDEQAARLERLARPAG